MAYNFFIDPAFNDFRVINGTLQLTTGQDTIRQQIYLRFNTEFGEWFLDTDAGLQYYSASKDINSNEPGILGGNFSAAQIRSLFQKEILSTPGIKSIKEDNLTYTSDRTLSYTATAIDENDDLIFLQVPTA